MARVTDGDRPRAKRGLNNGAEPSRVSRDPRELLLDPFNPRLSPDQRGGSQERLIEVMLERFEINEIAESICAAGFLPLDPFIAYAENAREYILEGNRRLAAIKLLLVPEIVPKRFAGTWDRFRARLGHDAVKKMSSIPVLLYSDRRDANILAYIGYRHVNGVLSWDAQEKANFIADLLEDERVHWSYEDVARKIGSKAPYVERLYVAHRLIEQAKANDVPGAAKMRTSFGVLTRALQSPGVNSFLAIEFPGNPKKSRQPCKATGRDLEDFARWTFGTEEVKPVLEDSRDLTKWGQILASTDAVRYLRSATDPRFERAYSKSGGIKEGLVEALMGAADRLAEAVPLVRQHRQAPDVRRGVELCADYIGQILAHFPEIASKQGLELRDAPNTGK